jgi:hypothetical protein
MEMMGMDNLLDVSCFAARRQPDSSKLPIFTENLPLAAGSLLILTHA